jgi:hypothetical protein
MNRDDFMKEARVTAQGILQGKENGIMNLVQRAWAEGKRNAEVETLRAAIDEALDRREPPTTMEDLNRLKGPEYPVWRDWLCDLYGNPNMTMTDILESPIDPEIAWRLNIVPRRTK